MHKKKSQHKIEQKEREILQSKVNPSGQGEDPAVKAILSPQFVEGSNMEALSIALAFQQMLKGQASLLENQSKFTEALERISARMDEMDRNAEKFENERERWLADITRMADKLKVSEARQEQMKAQAAIDLEQKTKEARASIIIDRKAFDEALAREPKVSVTSPGVIETVMVSGQPQARLYPEEVRIKHRRFVFMPGRTTEVPQSVAMALENRRKSQAETAERQEAMMKNMEVGELAKKMKEIDDKYKSSTAHLGESESLF